MKIKILASVIAALLSTTALADTSSLSTTTPGMGVLENDYVRAGVNGTTGTFGSGGNTSPGLLFDSTGTGTFDTSYDYLTPGSPFDGFSVMVDGTNYTNNNSDGGTAITNDGNGLTDGDGTLSWTGGVDSVFDITNTYSLGATTPYIDITSQITMDVGATILSFGRFIDPDARAAAGDSSVTDNVLGYGVIPDSNVAFSEALESRYALGLYSTDTNVDAGITRWTTAADSYTENMVDGDGSLTNTGDNTIGLSWTWTDVSAGDSLTASYAYIFGPSAFDAADDAITGGAGGGDTTTTDSWGTLEDVGSATDAAEGTAEPTVTASDYASATYTDGVTAGTVGIIGTGTHAHLDADSGLYETRTATFGGTLTMTRDSEVPTTWSDSSTTTESVSETFTRTVSGTHSDVMTDYTMDWDGATHEDTGTVNAPGFGWTFSEDLSTFSGSASDSGTISRTSTVSTDFTYDRTTETTNADDFDDASGYTDTTTTETTTSVVTATYDVNVDEEFTRTVTSSATGVEDTSVARVIDWDNATHTDTGSVATPDVTVTASSDFSSRSGTNTNTGTIARTSTANTTVTYDYVNTIVTVDDFADGSVYADTTTTTIGDAQTLEVTNALNYDETYTRTITVGVSDVMANSVAGDSVSVSQGIDEATVAKAISDPTVIRNGFTDNSRIVYTVTGEEVYEVTTPTEFTYDRTTTTTVANDFADGSAYADATTSSTATSTVSETYDVITEARVDREAGVNVDIKTDARQGDVVLDINRNITRGLTFGQVNVDRRTYDYGMYSGDSMLAQFGGTSVTDNGLAIGAGVLMSTTNFAGDTSNTAISSRTFGVTASREVNGWNLSSTIQHTESDVTKTENPSVTLSTFGSGIETSRITLPSVGSYTTEADAANSSLSFMAKGTGDTVRPIIGYTIGKEKIDNVTTQVIPGVLDIEHEGKSSNYSYASVGGEVSLGALSLTGIYHTDGVKDVAIGISKETDSTSLYVSASKTITDLGDTNSIRAGITIKF